MADQKRPSVIQTEDQNLKITTDEPLDPLEAKNLQNIRQLLFKLETTALNVNRLDYYGNAIPIGAFCNAVAFILFGFNRCHVFDKDSFLQGILIIFGGLGQITAGILEYLKVRSYSALLYLTLGFYCLSQFFIEDHKENRGNDIINKYFNIGNGNYEEIAFYYGAWFLITLPLVLGSLKINIFFLINSASTCFFFLFRWIGEVSKKEGLHDYTAGVFQLIAGFVSLYIFAYQIIDEQLGTAILPSITFSNDNEIDYNIVVLQGQTPQ
jgi:succinate-acetate transporter protein